MHVLPKFRAWLIAAALMLPSSLARAQAWTPMTGHGLVTFGAQYSSVHMHLFSVNMEGFADPATGYAGGPENQLYMGDIVSGTSMLSMDYGVLAGLALSGQIAYVSSRYTGLAPESEIDDGEFHGGIQDLLIGARYRLPIPALALTPFLTFRTALGDYSNIGHSALGLGLDETTLGLAAGRTLDPLLPQLALQASYAHDFVAGLHGFSLDRNLYAINAAYFLARQLTASAGFSYSESVDGFDWYWMDSSMEAFEDHDVAAKALVRQGGVGVSWNMSPRYSVETDYLWTISGSNTHAAKSVTMSFSRNFSTPRR